MEPGNFIKVSSLLLAVLTTAYPSAGGATEKPDGGIDNRRQTIKTYDLAADRPRERISTRLSGIVGPQLAAPVRRISVGASGDNAATAGPGIEVEASYDDWQGSSRGRRVDFWGTPDMHFVYQDQPAPITTEERAGYNVYSPTLNNWPKGLGIGCEVQAAGDYGIITSMAVTPKGRVILAGAEPLSQMDNHFYYQPSATAYSCTWGTGTKIPKLGTNGYSTWRGLASDTAPEMVLPIVETQIIGSDTITHVAARWQGTVNRPRDRQSATAGFPMLYYRKLGQTACRYLDRSGTSGYRLLAVQPGCFPRE